ncbi:hypothetical protein CONLIGDRAFT_235012 [Coniochaeta ligniaria NRRL 30616]|uniref:SH3 domain-containing protein n=1 Tax=Coniochaeta ligniaria NRRL 30616 TaxID=1408157 RepID=A0A1J7IWJ5_9PEZI|nr:hypothetical protein CONLIGDRAFT_235012 [Coniochaeta ligniaria NRRL 30616]
MDEDVQNLVLAPFQEVAEKGKTALENATDAGLSKSDDMLKAAQSLAKDGERALKKLEPLCKKLWDEYSTNFVVALKENDEIADFRTELNDLLWDFDSFIEVDDFEADEYSKLRTLSSKAAKRTYEILMRMKLEPPPIVFNSFDSAGISRTTSLAGRSYVSDTPLPPTETPQTIEEEASDTQLAQGPRNGALNTASLMEAKAGPDLGYEVTHSDPVRDQRPSPPRDADSRQKQRPPEPESPVIPHQLYAEQVRVEDIPAEPLVNPWQPTAQPTVTVDASPTRPPPDRRRRVSSTDSGRPYTPPFVVSNAFGEPNGPQSRPRRLDEGVVALEEMAQEADIAERNTAVSRTEPLGNGDQRPTARGTSPLPSQLRALPTPFILSPVLDVQSGLGPIGAAAQPIRRMLSSQRHSQASSTNSGRSSVFDPGSRDSMVSPVTDHRVSVHDDYNLSPVRTDSYPSIPEDRPVMSAGWSPTPRKPLAVRQGPSPQPPQAGVHPLQGAQADNQPFSSEHPGDQPGLILVQNTEDQPGLEVVSSGDGSAPGSGGGPPSVVVREPNCSITVDSSFYQLKGFCDGAKDIICGGVGVKKVRKGGIGAANTLVAKCTNRSCMFELEWKSVEADVNKTEQANYRNSGIGFRLRFISKSHLTANHIDDHKYGCLFCIQLGRTTEESDATVFPNQKALFSHLARHPRPLPPVPGLTVIETAEIPPQFRNNYDLHLPNPPARSLMTGLARELSSMPTAVATDAFRRTQISTLRALPDPSLAALQFFSGQRVVGLEFPARFNGEWALGWADNARGLFPADCVKMEAPPEREVRKTVGSGLRAVARWRRHPKEKDVKEGGWLRFEKGEVITNISFPYAEHWCWYGSNSRGRYGIFPQSHMEPNTLSETPGGGGDGASVISHESKSGASKMLAQFASIRRRDTRPVSSAGSHSSGDTATQMSPRPSVFS